ncbi:unnamed protein product [Sphenostylis stenocarpa]|uniref:Uncharacterized protein n=1 Tax=Sphenostylis stenocarpa TaxID=92480 RepID=A0AA86SBQ5_9FABA|nr:unnamed protein product [Sphenostylis stenocarpa]
MNSSRHRPLHTCAVSILAMVDIAVGKTQHINGPLGSTLKRVTKSAKFATPLIYNMQIQWLTILSFIDDAILAIEKVTAKLFPPSTRVFDKVDEIVVMIVSLPEEFDDAMNKFPAIIHEVPFLDWALTLVISRLNGLVSTLNHWGHENSRVNEKTIGVDKSCNEGCMDSSNYMKSENLENFPPIISECEFKVVHDPALLSHVRASYKEALERGKEVNPHEKQNQGCEVDRGDDCEGKEGREKSDGIIKKCDDHITKSQVGERESVKEALLELFESSWHEEDGSY